MKRLLFAPFLLVWAVSAFAVDYKLDWVDVWTGETGVKIQRKTMPAGAYATIYTAAANAVTYTDSECPGTCRYRITATIGGVDQPYSNEACVPTACSPVAPTGVHVSGQSTPAQISLSAAPAGAATYWSGILATDRATDWTTMGVEGGIPTTWANCVTTACNTLWNNGTDGTQVTAANINSAITSAPANTVVRVPGNGTGRTMSTGINMKSNVTLRGQGANLTILNFTGTGGYYWGEYLVGFIGYYDSAFDGQNYGSEVGSDPSKTRNWTGTNGQAGVYTKGATVINLATAPTGLAVGDMLQLLQADDTTNSSNLVVGAGGSFSIEGPGLPGPENGRRQNVRVVAINGTAVTIAPGLHHPDWKTSKSPKAYWWGNDIRMAGVEDMTINGAGAGELRGSITWFQAANCWVKGIHLKPLTGAGHSGTQARAGFQLYMTRNITIRDSLLNRMQGGGAWSTTSYGFEANGASQTLIENNILFEVESATMFNLGSQGVFAYNYNDSVFQFDFEETGIGAHDEGASYWLLEGSDVVGFHMDDYHGTTHFITVFRSRSKGTSPTNPRPAIDFWSNQRFANVVGNVLGTSGTHTRYQCRGSVPEYDARCDRFNNPASIYVLGYPSSQNSCTYEGVSCDAAVVTSLFRWGNWDIVTNGTRWCGDSGNTGWVSTCGSASELPTHAQYPNAKPATETLPASFYLSARPAWWVNVLGTTTPPWPPIGPDVTGGNVTGTGGHANKIPARLCYESISANLANFDRITCYPGS